MLLPLVPTLELILQVCTGGQDFCSIQVLMERLIAALDRFHAECRMQVAAEGIFVAVRSGLYTFRNRQFLCLLGNVAGLLYQRAARQSSTSSNAHTSAAVFFIRYPPVQLFLFDWPRGTSPVLLSLPPLCRGRWHGPSPVTDEGRDATSILFVGAAACPARSNFIRRNGGTEGLLPGERLCQRSTA